MTIGAGTTALPTGTLIDRALALLGSAAASSETIAHDVLGLPRAPVAVAERLAVALLGADPRVRRRTDGRWELAAGPAGAPSLVECAFAVVDVETTGGYPGGGDRITEVAVALVQRGRCELVYERLVNPGRPIPSVVTSITNITNNMVRDQPTFAAIAGDVLDVLEGRVFVAHNAPFDWRFVAGELLRARGLTLSGPRLCTVALTRRLVPTLKSRNLDSVTTYFGIDVAGRHRAAPDAVATGHVLLRLLELAAERGAVTLEDLVRLGRRARRPRRRRPAGPTSMDAI